MENTKEQGVLRFLIYKKLRDEVFTGICLDLGIVEENKNPQKLKKSLEEAATGYLETVDKEKLSDNLLNKPVPKKYLNIINEIEAQLKLTKKSPIYKKKALIEDIQFFNKEIKEPTQV